MTMTMTITMTMTTMTHKVYLVLLLVLTALASLTTATTCGECVPFEGDNVYIVTRLWTINSTDLTDMDVIDEFQKGFAPIATSLSGFIQYTAAQTGNESTVLFTNIFDTKEHAHTAQEAAKNFVGRNDILGNGAIIPYQFNELTVSAYITNNQCKKESYEGNFLSTRLYDSEESLSVEKVHNVTIEASETIGYPSMTGFLSYLGSDSEDDDGHTQFYYNIFETEEQSLEATNAGKAYAGNNNITSTNLGSTYGKIVFEYVCTIDYHSNKAFSQSGDNGSLNSAVGGGNFFRDAPLTLFSLLSFVATMVATIIL